MTGSACISPQPPGHPDGPASTRECQAGGGGARWSPWHLSSPKVLFGVSGVGVNLHFRVKAQFPSKTLAWVYNPASFLSPHDCLSPGPHLSTHSLTPRGGPSPRRPCHLPPGERCMFPSPPVVLLKHSLSVRVGGGGGRVCVWGPNLLCELSISASPLPSLKYTQIQPSTALLLFQYQNLFL